VDVFLLERPECPLGHRHGENRPLQIFGTPAIPVLISSQAWRMNANAWAGVEKSVS
jgi:hypothetical protein